MSMKITTPTNQIRLTNVAIVRLKKGGKRFELACYKNKVLSWRNKTEKDLDEVLQIETIFVNVSKGEVAKEADLEKCFKTTDHKKIILEILEKGELQVSDKERSHNLEQQYREICTLVMEMCVNPETQRPYPYGIIETAMKEAHYSVKPNRNTKQQALDAIKTLQSNMPLERAHMRIRIVLPQKEAKKTRPKLDEFMAKVLDEQWAGDLELVALIHPGKYRDLDELVARETRGQGTLELLDLKSLKEGEELLE